MPTTQQVSDHHEEGPAKRRLARAEKRAAEVAAIVGSIPSAPLDADGIAIPTYHEREGMVIRAPQRPRGRRMTRAAEIVFVGIDQYTACAVASLLAELHCRKPGSGPPVEIRSAYAAPRRTYHLESPAPVTGGRETVKPHRGPLRLV